jgi:hypothetical protein
MRVQEFHLPANDFRASNWLHRGVQVYIVGVYNLVAEESSPTDFSYISLTPRVPKRHHKLATSAFCESSRDALRFYILVE